MYSKIPLSAIILLAITIVGSFFGILENFRDLRLASILWNFNNEIIIMQKMHALLICERHIEPFHRKYNWKTIKNFEFDLKDHVPTFKPYFPMVFNLNHKLFGKKKTYFVNKSN